ncbi:1-phosphofructokinase [Paenibacillus dokdonensis]|uniref:Tagatose-6-phosphate kinase n=1 Tax=Paenibacillus dokdonensis TaxID=2567944 RepID=A0ABU6GR26_9BACL|nr:1-phosphofructokinase [Paenibacillus dokdonensis]MEC0242224.1 1-phosphofructokinase [Paenibacillus dokdonensis]
MITTVTLNAAIDKTYYLPSFPLGKVSRVQHFHAAPGGKGINVAKVISQLGVPVTATGFVGGMNGEIIRQQLTRMGIAHDFVSVEGESRICLNILDEANGTSTELLEPGPIVNDAALQEMEEKIRSLASQSKIVCFSGSLPAGVPKDFYVNLVTIAKEAGAYVILDASGDALRLGLEAKPDMIKPNEEEVAALLGIEVADEAALQQAVETLLQKYEMDRITVSLGGAGSLAAVKESCYRVTTPKVKVVNTVGCGDSFVAGMAVSLAKGLSLEEGLAVASAAGTSNAMTDQAGQIDPEEFEQLRHQVQITRI